MLLVKRLLDWQRTVVDCELPSGVVLKTTAVGQGINCEELLENG
jgi:hypothetical protein